MNQRKISIVLLFFLLISCEKKSDNDEIMIGDYSNMIVNSYDINLNAGVLTEYTEFSLDIDRDSNNDIALRCGYVHGWSSWGSYRFSEIRSLHKNALILGFYKTDTIFLNRETYKHSTSQGTQISEYYNHTCFRKDPTDSILEIISDNFKVFPKDKGSILSNSEVFKSDTIKLIQSELSHFESIPISDTLFIINNYVSYNDCQSFSQDEIKYIGIKLEQDGNVKLGWIKIIVSDIHKIILFESAIHE